MSLNRIKRELRQLPYTEMKEFAEHVGNALDELFPAGMPHDFNRVADVLTGMPPDDSESLQAEQMYLARAFTKKRGGKCSIELRPQGSGWEVKAGDFTHVGPTIRHAISELLDEIAAYEALTNQESLTFK